MTNKESHRLISLYKSTKQFTQYTRRNIPSRRTVKNATKATHLTPQHLSNNKARRIVAWQNNPIGD